VEVAENFPEECRYVLETLGGIWHHDALAREQKLSPEERLRFHQEHSGPLMETLHDWMEAQLSERKTEPNSGLGKAIRYMLRHWLPLTLFLREPGAPIDNNLVTAARGSGKVMPRPGLCRAPGSSDPPACLPMIADAA
jgi:transposase